MAPLSCTCILPTYNEGKRLHHTLARLLRLTSLSSVIVVDDGSTDRSCDHLQKRFPSITLISLPVNQGKTAAIQAGLSWVTTSHILLFDADLRQSQPGEYAQGIQYALSHPAVDMLIFIRSKDVSSVYSGERVVKTDILKESLRHFPATGFQLEAAINQYCLDQQLQVVRFPTSARNTYKIMKMGFTRGSIHEFIMIGEIIKLVGLKNYLRQQLLLGQIISV